MKSKEWNGGDWNDSGKKAGRKWNERRETKGVWNERKGMKKSGKEVK